MIRSKRRLNGEIKRIKNICLDNGYPENVVNAQIAKKIAQFSTLKRFGPEKCPVYLRVLWMGKPFTNLKKEVKTDVESCFGFISVRLVFRSKCMLPVARKDVLPATQKSFVVNKYYPALPASHGKGAPTAMSGFSISVQPAALALRMGLLCEQ